MIKGQSFWKPQYDMDHSETSARHCDVEHCVEFLYFHFKLLELESKHSKLERCPCDTDVTADAKFAYSQKQSQKLYSFMWCLA